MVLGTVVVLAHTMAAGCRAERQLGRDDHAGPEGRRAEHSVGVESPTSNPVTTEEGGSDSASGPSGSADGSDSSSLMTEGCRSESSEEAAERPHAERVEVRTSNIPTAGDGLFAKVDIAAETYIGDYTGRYLTEDEVETLPEFESAYLMEFPSFVGTAYDCIAGDTQHYVSKVNFAPSRLNGQDTNLQNVRWESFCTEPYVRLYSTRDITAGEELYVDYGPSYAYGFMELPAVQAFFSASIGASPEDGFVFEYPVDS